MHDKIVYKCKNPNKSLHPPPYLMRAIHKNGNVHSSAHFVCWDDVSSYGHILLFSNQCHKFYLRFAIAFVQCTYRLHFRYTHRHTVREREWETVVRNWRIQSAFSSTSSIFCCLDIVYTNGWELQSHIVCMYLVKLSLRCNINTMFGWHLLLLLVVFNTDEMRVTIKMYKQDRAIQTY